MKKKIILLISGKGTNAINITNYFQNNNSVEVSLISVSYTHLRAHET